jgi:hypothetical protein
MEKEVTIYCKNTKSYHVYPLGISLIEIYEDLKIELKFPVMAARVNYKVEDLNFMVYKPKDIEFIDMSSPSGMRVYVRTLSMVLAKAVSELFPQATLRIEHPISKGYYCQLDNLGQPIDLDVINRIKENELFVKRNRPEWLKSYLLRRQIKKIKQPYLKHLGIRIFAFSASTILLIIITEYYCLRPITWVYLI